MHSVGPRKEQGGHSPGDQQHPFIPRFCVTQPSAPTYLSIFLTERKQCCETSFGAGVDDERRLGGLTGRHDKLHFLAAGQQVQKQARRKKQTRFQVDQPRKVAAFPLLDHCVFETRRPLLPYYQTSAAGPTPRHPRRSLRTYFSFPHENCRRACLGRGHDLNASRVLFHSKRASSTTPSSPASRRSSCNYIRNSCARHLGG